ncbi:hypothetical protein Cob_v004940 [Colletotrichum orbiculare MAFF 240422]|uniref:Uncharacterized protein n=1 Tax=Colletotrichum orbiculare (strain 104-T / ATCC 96160 / CBS 514.97 / LARS 414 / MAFF 240422) TaxID=1213857 RepID=A0A484FUZ4_COLOR|nr:hypothetical protein Cob_v004940 [Colletotrichum orbiculare MAFF 240422]
MSANDYTPRLRGMWFSLCLHHEGDRGFPPLPLQRVETTPAPRRQAHPEDVGHVMVAIIDDEPLRERQSVG